MKPITYDSWIAQGIELFGPDKMNWRFKCPVCGFEAAAKEWIEAGASESAIGFSCIGRWRDDAKDAFFSKRKKGPCNYAGGGLFQLNPVHVQTPSGVHKVFQFAGVES